MDWRALPQATLEHECNPRLQVADAEGLLTALAARSAAARERLGPPLEIAYGDHPLERVDVFPARGPRAPLHLFFHGGYWRGQDKRDYAFIAEALGARGVTVALANYPLCPEVDLHAIHTAARRCVQRLLAEAPGLGADSARLSLSGHSAGGQIVARLLADGAGAPGAAVAVSGVFDVEPVVHTSINQSLQLDEPTARAVSPLHAPAPRWPGPLLLAVGGAESLAFREQTRAYAAHCRDTGTAVESIEPPGRHHFDILDALYRADGEAFATLCRLLGVAGEP